MENFEEQRNAHRKLLAFNIPPSKIGKSVKCKNRQKITKQFMDSVIYPAVNKIFKST